MKTDKKIAKGKVAVIKKNGTVIMSKRADKGLRIEYNSEQFEVTEKAESKLTSDEKSKLK